MPFPDLLAAYANAEPLTDERNPDGKSLRNPPADRLSPCYHTFPAPIRSDRNGFDFHVYYTLDQLEYARNLHQRIKREFPEVFVYRVWEQPVGPHPTPMFEIQTVTPHQTGALFSFLTVNRGPLSVFVHPHTGDPVRDHTQNAIWMGRPWELRVDFLPIIAFAATKALKRYMPFPDLLVAFANAEPLGDERNPDGKSLRNPPAPHLSPCYNTFPAPIQLASDGNGFFDFHVYYTKDDIEYARQLHERIRREFPELCIKQFWEHPVGPHPTPMFEVNVFTPHQTGAIFSFLAVYRGPLSVFIHPHTGDPYRDHTDNVIWMGRPWELRLDVLRPGAS
ncbi:hypothetical protein AX14_009364 [Amanita brunnescens Koide BX004]|nr:hypothetical protein AX14_009364 [Amanita brunnescens Koide BX004]